jgi:Rne/Rng family ribonuclease
MPSHAHHILIAPEGAALLDRGIVEDLILAGSNDTVPAPGEIHRGRIDRLVPKLGAAFVRLANGKTGYLRDVKNLREGDSLTVQVTAYAETGKASPVDQRIVIKGSRIILTPGVSGVNVSRQIRNSDERARLAAAVGGVDPDCDPGIILRSAAEGTEVAVLLAELDGLRSELDRIETDAGTGPAVLLRIDPAAIALREWTLPPPQDTYFSNRVLEGRELANWERDAVPFLTIANEPDLFGTFGVWDEIEHLKSPRVDLPSGAWMAVETTRAMVTVDVNTAGEFGGGSALTANLEAAKELPRQLRLRGLGGQVIIDFAPLKKTGRRRIEEALKSAFRKDPIETTLAGWTPLGNFELQRKRERRPLSELLKPE